MLKNRKFVILSIAALVIITITGILGFFLPYCQSDSAMPGGSEFTIEQQADGFLLLSWPKSNEADYYHLKIIRPAKDGRGRSEVIYDKIIKEGTSCILPSLPAEEELTMRLYSVIEYSAFGIKKIRDGSKPLEITTTFGIPSINNLVWEADSDSGQVNISFCIQNGDHCRFYLLNTEHEKTELKTLTSTEFKLTFGKNADFELPEYGKPYNFCFEACRREPGLSFYGYVSADITIERDDLLGCELSPAHTYNGYNVWTIKWAETKGDYYEVQMLDESSGQWSTVCKISENEERVYTTPHLPAFDKFIYRIAAINSKAASENSFAAVSDEIVFTTMESPIFCTVWPVSDLKAYSSPLDGNEIGTVKTGQAYYVVEESNGMFGVLLGTEICYIDSNYCMINLPEYIGNICRYNITNSYSSLYMVHEFEIPRVTGVVTSGYENIRLNDGSYLVPLIYPTAQKLAAAAKIASEQGYRLKIYDTYRPNMATREIYNLTYEILDSTLPSRPFTDVNIASLNLPAPRIHEVGDENAEAAEATLTYRDVMTDDVYGLNYFLAPGRSMHNFGVALDLTLEMSATGEELKMQTSMHDLSRYSVLSKNNDAANILANIMKEAGFGGLVSEWWHFQDNDAVSNLSLPALLNGVSAECWITDGVGIKYRAVSGDYYTDCSAVVSGSEYTFDENGYVIAD